MSALRKHGCLVHSFSLPKNSMPRGNSFPNLTLNIHFALLRSDLRLRARMFFLKRSSLNEARSILGDLPVFWEAPPDRTEQTIALLAQFNSDADSATFGYKLRTGGVTADAFPTSMQIAKALVTPATHQLPLKFTAGLHHPLRQYREEVETKMHGFLNGLGAAVLAAEHRWDANQTAIMLDEENAESFSFTDDFFAWREWRIDTKRLQYRRRFVVSFGSCSFDEPRDDLRALNLL